MTDLRREIERIITENSVEGADPQTTADDILDALRGVAVSEDGTPRKLEQQTDAWVHSADGYIEGIPFGCHYKAGDAYHGSSKLDADDGPLFRLVEP